MKRILIIALVAFTGIFSNAIDAYAQRKDGVVTASSMVVTRTRIKDPIKITWQNNIEATVSEHYQISYTGGWRFENFMFFGFGTGVQIYPNVIPWDEDGTFSLEDLKPYENKYYNPSRIAIPIYANIKFRFLKKKVSPYLSASGGLLLQGNCLVEQSSKTYTYTRNDINGTYYAEVFIGADLRLKNGSSISLGLGPLWTGQDYEYLNPKDNMTRASGGYKLVYSF